MKLGGAYNFKFDAARTRFEFLSEGPKGRIIKLVELTFTGSHVGTGEVYNLALGDRNATGQLDDQPVTANGDAQRVLLTVAAIVETFTEQHPDAVVFATGGTPARTRLYQMGIANNLAEVQRKFEVYGLVGTHWQAFQPGVSYAGFLVRRKPGL